MLVAVALPVPLFRTFTYEVDAADAARALPGMRAVVRVRNRSEIGVIIGPGELPAGVSAKKVLALPDHEPVIGPSLVAVGRWMSSYYAAPPGITLRTMLPALLLAERAPEPPRRTRRIATISRGLPSLMERDAAFKRSPRRRAAYELIESLGGRVPVEHLVEQLQCSPSVIQGLVKQELIAIEDEVVNRDPFMKRSREAAADHSPTPAQRAAIEAVASASSGSVFLLHGVTGSGKTLVYLEVLRRVLAQGRGAIVLVPEIALTPQTVDRFRAVFGDQVAVLHSALSDGERYDAWLALRSGAKRIAIGARSALFAPIADLGAIIVDEEHESSYKQGESPRYHAREVAIVRAKEDRAVVVLGSATPSLETWSNATTGKYHLLALPQRVAGATLPQVAVLDMRAPRPVNSTPTPLLPPLEQAIADRLRKGEQTILLLNRRGYASFVQCERCGFVATCPRCSISLTYHRAPEALVCHYCRHTEPIPTRCPRGDGPFLRQRGLGTQQVERIVAERFPSARIARMDVDTTSAKWSHSEILDRVARREVDILLGTQMIAKGLDFPSVTLVGVIDADVGINLPDFRASERCFQLLSQVAGRAGRGALGGTVLIQTRVPNHHAVRAAVAHDYAGFVQEELAARREPPYPPNVRLANVVCSGADETLTADLAADVVARVQAALRALPEHEITLVGPAPCPIERIKNRWRWHALIKSRRPSELTRVCRYIVERVPIPRAGQLRIALDRDPVALL